MWKKDLDSENFWIQKNFDVILSILTLNSELFFFYHVSSILFRSKVWGSIEMRRKSFYILINVSQVATIESGDFYNIKDAF